MSVLQLGNYDTGKKPANLASFFKPYHVDGILATTNKFRSDDNNRFEEWEQADENDVQKLQEFLYDAGFMTKKYNEGVYDYVTEAAVRLFQEYMATIENKSCSRDGKVGPNTWQLINQWPKGKKCNWHSSITSNNPSHKEYTAWMDLLDEAKTYYSDTNHQGPIMRAVNQASDTGSTIKTQDWKFERDKIHLVGIRRNESKSISVRKNDDLFILLINGMVFKFWGSTDPKVKKGVTTEPFLVEGQHLYRFGWHNLGAVGADKKHKRGAYVTYRALRPANNRQNVLVVRDKDNDDKLSKGDLGASGLELSLANYINVHWTGTSRSQTTWSAGCQVIKGQSYMNDRGEIVDYSDYTAATYEDLFKDKKKHKGAYRFLTDLVVCYSEKGVNTMYYTLGNENEELAKLGNVFGETYVRDALKAMKADES